MEEHQLMEEHLMEEHLMVEPGCTPHRNRLYSLEPSECLQFITVLQYIFPACKWTFLERSIKVSWRAGGRSLDPSGPSHCYLVFLTFCGRGLSTIWLFAERSLKVLSTETLNEPSGNVPQRLSVQPSDQNQYLYLHIHRTGSVTL